MSGYLSTWFGDHSGGEFHLGRLLLKRISAARAKHELISRIVAQHAERLGRQC